MGADDTTDTEHNRRFFPILISTTVTCPFPIHTNRSKTFLDRSRRHFFNITTLTPHRFPTMRFLPIRVVLPFTFLVGVHEGDHSTSTSQQGKAT